MHLRYAYNTNGCAHHRLPDALKLIAEAGYNGVALTLDWQHLDPLADDWEDQTHRVATLLRKHRLGCVIETGARFLLDPAEKHEPTLINPVSDRREVRIDFLKRAVDVAAILGAETVSFWSGIKQQSVTDDEAMHYLIEGLQSVMTYAQEQQVTLSFEPEPGMFIETNADYERLLDREPALHGLKLALDLGHVWVTGEGEPAKAISKYADRLGTVSIEGMNRGVHLHLPLHEGDMPIPPLVRTLQEVNFTGLVCVELSRESPRAHLAIPESINYLKALEHDLQA
jgi:sugar phosphate isomerase/epimerase